MNSSVGDILRQAREKQGRSIAEVAKELCLTHRYVLAIEENDLSSLPATFFYKSFARQYANFLGIEPSSIEPALRALTGGPDIESSGTLPVDPVVESTNRHYFADHAIGWPVAALVLVLLACSGFYAWWNRVPQAAAVRTETRSSVTPAAISEVSRQIPADLGSNGEPTTVVLNLAATDTTWVSITSGGKEIFSGVLEPSQSKTVAGVNIATMRIGNAAGVEVRLNGKPIGPLGTKGEVLTVRFTPQDFQILRPSERL